MNFLRQSLWLLATLLLAGTFASLGFWQKHRGEAKQRWFDGYDAALHAPARDLVSVLAQPATDVPIRITGRLRFVDAPLLLLDNQQRNGQVGVRAYAIATSGDGSPAVLVELGWLPMGANRQPPVVSAPSGELDVEGFLQPWPGQGLRIADNPWDSADSQVLLMYLDREEIQSHTKRPLYDGVLQPDPDLAFGYQRDAGVMPNTLPPQRHWGYAVQWWGLSLTVIAVYLVLRLRRSAK